MQVVEQEHHRDIILMIDIDLDELSYGFVMKIEIEIRKIFLTIEYVHIQF